MQDLYYGSISERETLAQAITSKGVLTNTSDKLSTMASNIKKLSSDKLLGSLTYSAANQTLTMNISTMLSNYKTLTNSNFKAYISNSDKSVTPGDAGSIVLNFKFPKISYNADTGILSVTNGYCSWTAANWGSGSFYFSQVEIIYVS